MNISEGASPLGGGSDSPAVQQLSQRMAEMERNMRGMSRQDVRVLSPSDPNRQMRMAMMGFNMGEMFSDPGTVVESTSECLLGSLSADPENVGKQKILEGFITGGGTSIYLEKGNITPVIDDWLWVKVSWTADEEDDVLMEGGTMTAAVIEQGGDLPDDDPPAVGSTAGEAYVPLGKWVSNGGVEDPKPVWKRWGCGSITIKFCASGIFYYLRSEVSEEVPPYYYY